MHCECVKIVLNSGADVKHSNKDLSIAMMLAARKGTMINVFSFY